MDYLHLDFGLGVGKSTKFLVLTLGSFVVIDLAKFTFVPSRMIYLLNFIMGIRAVFELTIFLLTEFMAVIFKIRSSLVNVIVVENAGFPFMMI